MDEILSGTHTARGLAAPTERPRTAPGSRRRRGVHGASRLAAKEKVDFLWHCNDIQHAAVQVADTKACAAMLLSGGLVLVEPPATQRLGKFEAGGVAGAISLAMLAVAGLSFLATVRLGRHGHPPPVRVRGATPWVSFLPRHLRPRHQELHQQGRRRRSGTTRRRTGRGHLAGRVHLPARPVGRSRNMGRNVFRRRLDSLSPLRDACNDLTLRRRRSSVTTATRSVRGECGAYFEPNSQTGKTLPPEVT